MTNLDLLLCATATWQIVEVWHHGSLFAGARAALQSREGFLPSLLSCPFCLSLWVAMAVAAYFCLTQGYWHLPVQGLVVARMANLLNDMTHSWCRTPSVTIE